MASSIDQNLLNVERQLAELEANLSKLRKTLQFWQSSEVAYLGIKEDIEPLLSTASSQEMLDSALGSVEDNVVKEKDIKDLLAYDKIPPRTKSAVLQALDRRVEYVNRNVEGLQKQVDGIEEHISRLSSATDENIPRENLPVTEISEELDDDGNVISSIVSHPDEQTSKDLQRIFVENTKNSSSKPDNSGINTNHQDKQGDTAIANGRLQKPNPAVTGSFASDQDGSELRSKLESPAKRQRSVAFAESVTAIPASENFSSHNTHFGESMDENQSLAEIAKGSFQETDRVVELDENDVPIAATDSVLNPRTPDDDAALRRDMLKHNLSKIENVVAEMDLDFEDSDETGSDLDAMDEDEHSHDMSDDENENEYGISTTSAIDDNYRKEMLALEAKLNGRMEQNLGPNPNFAQQKPEAEDDKSSSTAPLISQKGPAESNPKSRLHSKGVRFAEELDISPIPRKTEEPEAPVVASVDKSAPLLDAVIERSGETDSQDGVKPLEPKRVSRFKAARQAKNTV